MERTNVMSIHNYRRLTGLLFGAGLGLMFGLTSQLTNRILLPGIPLYQPPLGRSATSWRACWPARSSA